MKLSHGQKSKTKPSTNSASEHVLKLPDFEKTFEVIVDACGQGIGGILQQDHHPIAYKS